MSIVTLKKKTKQLYHSLSVGRPAFSLNGTHRSQGWVGQTSLSRSLPRTPHRGVTAQGHGGSYGAYSTTSVNIVSGIDYQNDPTYVKSSVLDTKGMIMTKYRWIRRPAPFVSVKPDSTQHQKDQSMYLELLRRQAVQTATDVQCGVVEPLTPLSFQESSTLVVLGQLRDRAYKNGTYVATESSASAAAAAGYQILNGSNRCWQSSQIDEYYNEMNYAGDVNNIGKYVGSSATFIYNVGAAVGGAWVQLEIPEAYGSVFTLTQYSMLPCLADLSPQVAPFVDHMETLRDSVGSSPMEWYVCGSNDGIRWVKLDHQRLDSMDASTNYWSTKYTSNSAPIPTLFSLPLTSQKYKYRYYRIIVVRTAGDRGYASLQQWNLQGVVTKGDKYAPPPLGCCPLVKTHYTSMKTANNWTKRVGPLSQSMYLYSAASGCATAALNPKANVTGSNTPFACHGSLNSTA
jgi:hypothetical protein